MRAAALFLYSDGLLNFYAGWSAGNFTNTGAGNTGIGALALYHNGSGADNSALGADALAANTSGSQNVADGVYALQNNTTGTNNVAVGYQAGINITNGGNNIDIGNQGQAGDNNIIRIGNGQSMTYIAGTIQNPTCTTITCSSITITGGSDLAEPFEVSSPTGEMAKGSVVVIDEKNAGQLKVSCQPYDSRVAGVLSGANGIKPGIQMQQQGLLEGTKSVALSGRVYVLADTANGAIMPGDLLTTSGTPGHAMKVTDHLRAQGAILGKAMTGLSEGKGMVLVLVTLQ